MFRLWRAPWACDECEEDAARHARHPAAAIQSGSRSLGRKRQRFEGRSLPLLAGAAELRSGSGAEVFLPSGGSDTRQEAERSTNPSHTPRSKDAPILGASAGPPLGPRSDNARPSLKGGGQRPTRPPRDRVAGGTFSCSSVWQGWVSIKRRYDPNDASLHSAILISCRDPALRNHSLGRPLDHALIGRARTCVSCTTMRSCATSCPSSGRNPRNHCLHLRMSFFRDVSANKRVQCRSVRAREATQRTTLLVKTAVELDSFCDHSNPNRHPIGLLEDCVRSSPLATRCCDLSSTRLHPAPRMMAVLERTPPHPEEGPAVYLPRQAP